MAHHLAGLITEADTASGDTRALAETRAVDLILRLWARRRDLRDAADPLGPCRDAVNMLSRLRAERNPWLAYSGRGGPEGMLADIFDNMAKVVVGGVLLTQAGKLREIAPAEEAALSPEEVALREQLAWWEAAITPEIPDILKVLRRTRVHTVAEMSSHAGDLEELSDLGETISVPGGAADNSSLPGEGSQLAAADDPGGIPPATRRPQEQVTEALERLQADFARLVDAWKAGPARA